MPRRAQRPGPHSSAPTDLPTLRLALRVAELGSVAAAARELDLLPATATAAVRRLESQLGAALFARSTRALKVTPEGDAYLARAREALDLLDQGAAELHAPLTQVRGVIRLAVSVDLGTQVVRPLMDEFLRLHPQLQLEMLVSDRLSDIGREPVDAALRYGEPRGTDQIVRPLADNTAVLVASPAYVQRAGMPRSVAELAEHEAIGLRVASRPGQPWSLQDRGREVQVRPRVRRTADNGLMARLWALDGHGIALKSRLDVAADLLSGRLVRVLPRVQTAPYPLMMVLVRGTHLSARMRALADYLRPPMQALAESASDERLAALPPTSAARASPRRKAP